MVAEIGPYAKPLPPNLPEAAAGEHKRIAAVPGSTWTYALHCRYKGAHFPQNFKPDNQILDLAISALNGLLLV
jgi:hypothetical protein